MAKTIYEMAVEYSKVDLPNGKVGTDKFEKDAYIVGANAVLQEIEAILPQSDKSLNDAGKALVWRLRDKIKELEGI